MSLLSRIVNALRPDRLTREIDEEFRSHLAEAVERGRDPADARRAFGSALRQQEASREIRVLPWLDSVRADAVFGWRQLMKKKAVSSAAVFSLALGIGACTSAFRLIDAMLLRPLPVAEPGRLFALSREGLGWTGKPESFDGFAYPSFRRMRDAVKDQADLIAISYADRVDLTYTSDQAMEKAQLQYVSGWMFASFGIRPALGRLFTGNDDLHPGAHPYAVLSFDYWSRRFARDPAVIGRSLRIGNDLYTIAGVAGEGFTGTETGIVIDIFLPTMMNPAVERSDSTWVRVLARVKPGAAMEPLRQKLHATSRAFEEDRAKLFTGMSRQRIANFLNQTLVLNPAAAGVSGMQHDYRRSLLSLAVLVALVLLIACANVANLMTAQAAARAREMALRVSIGAGRWRLTQLLLVESAWLAFLAAAIGGLFAWWSAPFVVGRINPPDNPARLALPADWRVLGFGLALTLAVTFLFGLVPALRASSITPVSALKGGEDPHSRRRLMHALIAAQVAFCFLVVFVAGLFVATFDRLSNEPTGFSAERILTLDTIAPGPQPPGYWNQVAEHLRSLPGVETVAFADSALLNGNARNSFVSANGEPPPEVLTYFRYVSPGWTAAMKISFIDGRDFTSSDTSPSLAIVNQAFAKLYFNAESPVGKTFRRSAGGPAWQIVGLVRDARYGEIRSAIPPVAYVPFQGAGGATFIVRTANSDPLTLASVLRREIPRARPGVRVSNIRTQLEINQAHTIRERLLAMLASFFAIVALLLAGVGLYGVLDYSVLQRRREIGIRMAIGAQVADIARRVTADVFRMVLAGALAGLALGMASVRYIETLLYQVKPRDMTMLALPSFTIVCAAFLAAIPAVVRAVRIDPVTMLRSE